MVRAGAHAATGVAFETEARPHSMSVLGGCDSIKRRAGVRVVKFPKATRSENGTWISVR